MSSNPVSLDFTKAVPIGQTDEEKQAQTLRQSVSYGAQQNPDAYAKLIDLHKQTGVPPVVSQGNEAEVQHAADVDKLDYPTLVASHPRTTAWASNPDNAAVAGVDEVQRLANIESRVGSIRALTPWEQFQSFTLHPLHQKLMSYPLTRWAVDAAAGTAGMVGDIGSLFGINGPGPTKENALQRVQTSLSPAAADLNINGRPDQGNTLDTLVSNVAPMIPAMIASGGTSLLARTLGISGKAAKVLSGLSVGALFTAQQGGRTLTQQQASGASDYDARLASNRVMAMNAPVNALFGATDLIPALERNPFATSLILGGSQGGVGQFSQNVVTGQPLSKDVLTGAIQGAAMQGGMHLGSGFFEDMAHIVTSAEQSKLRQRSPDKFHDAMTRLFEGQESLKIPAEQFDTYFQSKNLNPAEVAQQIGAKNYAEAKVAGTEIEIPPADFVGKLDPEHQKGLLADIVNPETGMTANQMNEGEAELQKWIQEGGPDKLSADTAKADAETQASPEYQSVKTQLRQQYIDAGETPEIAENYATLQANVYSNLARETGMKAEELMGLYRPVVKNGEAPGAPGQLNQGEVSSPEFKNWFGESKVVDKSGKPLVVYHGSPDARFMDQDATFKSQKDRIGIGDETGVHWFTPSRKTAASYADDHRAFDYQNAEPKTVPAYLKLENPLEIDAQGKEWREAQKVGKTSDIIKRAQDEGYDGVIIRNVKDDYINDSKTKTTDTYAVFDSRQIKHATDNRGTFDPNDPNILHQAAFHGSPYRFDKFSLEHLGKGEGAQAYGWGLYFAGDKSVAEYYKNALSALKIDGRDASTEEVNAYSVLQSEGGDITKAVESGRQEVEKHSDSKWWLREIYERRQEVLESWAKKQPTFDSTGGQLYEADIPNDDTLLDYDKPLSQQSDKVKEALYNSRTYVGKNSIGWREAPEGLHEKAMQGITGDKLYRELQGFFGSQEETSKFLHSLGINGIKYLDSNSRFISDDAKAHHNYVIFDDKAINILKTYYQDQESPRGWFRVMPDGSFEIGKTNIGDLSTFVHEPAHSYLEIIKDLASKEGSSDNLKGDYQKILDFLGAKEGDKLTTEQHEKWARANEQYLREGKAPSEGLKGVFQRFAVWLTTIYKHASDLGVNLSDDIRGVFDRMYASEEGVNRAAKESGPQLFTSPEEAGWTPEQFQKYADSKGMEVEQAKSEIVGKMNEAAVRERSDAWREEENNVREAVSAEIDAKQEYQAIRALRDGKLKDGSELKLNRDELVKQFGEERVKELQKQHPMLYRKEGGVDADIAAEILGYGSGDEMLRKLLATPRRSAAIEAATREYMTAKHGDIRYDGTLDDQARIALENDKKAENSHKELVALRKKLAETKVEAEGKKAAVKAIQTAPLQAYREAARQMIENKAVADIQPHRYLDANRMYSKEAFDALRSGDVEKAADAKHKELLNHYLFREGVKGKEFISNGETYAKRMGTAKELGKLGMAGQSFLDQIRGFLNRYGFTRNGDQGRQENLSQFLTRMKDDENYEIPIDPILLDESQQKNYRNVPLGEFRAVIDGMKAIDKAARMVNSTAAEGKRVALNAAAAQLESKLFESLGKPEIRNASDEARSWIEKFKGSTPDIAVVLPEFTFERWDGLKKQGPWHEFFWDRYNDAVDHKNRLLEKVWPQIEASSKANIDGAEKFYIESMDVTLTKNNILSIAHNAGNESNLDKQMRGGLQFKNDMESRPISPEALMEILSHLTPEDINLVNSNWRALETLKPDAAELARKRSGIEPKWIETKPLQVKNGTLEGGYWPVHFDPRFSAAGEKQVDTALSVDKMFTKYASANTNQGYLIERTGYVAPLSLDWQQTMGRHLNNVVTDISHWEFASDAQRLLKHPQTKTAIISRMGELYYKNLLDWVRNTVKQGTIGAEASDTLAGFRKNMRSKVSTAVLGFRVANAVVETGITPILALQHVSAESSLHGVTTYLQNPIQATKFATEASDYIRHIDTGIDRNVTETIHQLAGDHSLIGDIRRWSIQSRVAIWKIGAVMAWHAGYHDAMTQGLEGKAAVRVADSIYRMTQESGRPGDLSAVQRNPYMNELTMFIGPSLIQYNNLRRSAMAFKDQGLTAQTAQLGVTTLLAGLAANTILFDYLRGKAPDDKKKLPAWMAARMTFGAMDGLPIINQFATATEKTLLGEPGGDMKLIPVLQVGKDTKNAAVATHKALKGSTPWPGAIKSDARSVGEWTGLPMTQATITGQYIYDVMSGQYKPAHPWSPITDAFYSRPNKGRSR